MIRAWVSSFALVLGMADASANKITIVTSYP